MSYTETGVSFFDSILEFIYGPPKKKRKISPNNENTRRIKPEDAPPIESPPEATEADLLTVLHITKLDLQISTNTERHKTHKYACTKDREVGGVKEEAELIVRRGEEFKVTLIFDRPFNKERDDLRIVLKTGALPDIFPATHGEVDVVEGYAVKYEVDKWAGRVLQQQDNNVEMEIHIPATCAIGEWSLCVDTRTLTDGKKTKTFRYEHPNDFYILFNPWCKDDSTFMANEEELEEYVLNDHGCVYRGNPYNPDGKPWNFGQYEEGILEASLFVVLKCLKPKQMYMMSDPVKLARIIAQVVNCNDSDKGVLHGRWDGNYSDGDSPSDWYGSVRILQRYMETGQPVKYGQCWVFSGLTTTVCRALGLPARSVTNFNSAHDTDESNTIDIYYSRNHEGELVRDRSSDSIWNYHVWNEVWMSRPDLTDKAAKAEMFTGWQAIDATPQERSDGVFTCGPCPVYAVKHGLVNTPYDGSFIFSEVNADECHWEPTPEGYRRFKISIDKIGRCISTKKANGKPYVINPWYDIAHVDITENYKYDEESEENRTAVMRAALGARKPKDAYIGLGDKEDVDFKLLHDADLPLGKPVPVTLVVINTSEYRRKLTLVTFRFIRQDYYGNEAACPFKIEKIKKEVELERNKEYKCEIVLKHEDYLPHIDEGRCISIQAYAFVEATRSRPMQNCVKAHTVMFGAPVLEVEMPTTVKKGTEFEAVVKFNNPLPEELTECKAGYEGGGFQHVTGVKQNNVAAYGLFSGKFQLKAHTEGTFTLTFKFTSKQLKYLSGSAQVKVDKP